MVQQAQGEADTVVGGETVLVVRPLLAAVFSGLVLAPDMAAPPESTDWGQDAGVVAPVAPGIDPLDALANALAPARAWGQEGVSSHFDRARTEATRLGYRNLEPAAWALLRHPDSGDAMARTAAAVRLAPDLPLAHWEQARAHWHAGTGFWQVLDAGTRALASLGEHPEARLWLEAAWLRGLAWSLCGGALLFIWLSALPALRWASRCIARRLPAWLPDFAPAALLAFVLLLPAFLGEGWLGLALVGFGFAWISSASRQRVALVAAAMLFSVGLHPLLGAAARATAALDTDSLAQAALSVDRRLPTTAEVLQLAAASREDPLAGHAFALWLKRTGRVAEAEALFRELEAQGTVPGARVLNDAANVSLALGNQESAVERYLRAAEIEESAEVFFNLAVAHGVIDFKGQEQALARALTLDSNRFRELQDFGLGAARAVVDLGPDPGVIHAGVLVAADSRGLARSLRASLGPGLAGRNAWLTLLAFGFVAGGFHLWMQRSRKVFERSELPPGWQFFAAQSGTWLWLASTTASVGVLAFLWGRDGVVSDAFVVGGAGPMFLALTSGVFGLLSLSLWSRVAERVRWLS